MSVADESVYDAAKTSASETPPKLGYLHHSINTAPQHAFPFRVTDNVKHSIYRLFQ